MFELLYALYAWSYLQRPEDGGRPQDLNLQG